MFAAPILIDKSMTNYSAGVSGNGNRIKFKMAANTETNRHLSPRSRPIFLTHLIFHYPLPLSSHSIRYSSIALIDFRVQSVFSNSAAMIAQLPFLSF